MIDKKDLKFIADYLIKRDETVAVAESVTAGLIMNLFSLTQNASQFFQGGVVAYNLGQKARHLDVEPIHAEERNCVSEQVAEQMARSVALQFCASWGIGITGYAVPVPELNISSCFALYAFVYKGTVASSGCLETKLRGQFNVQQYFASQIVKVLKAHFL